MQIHILLEPVAGNGYRASAGSPFGVTAEGASQDEALQNLRQTIEGRLAAGAQIIALEVAADNPWTKVIGMFKDDPFFEDWQKAIAEYRQKVQEDPNIP